MEKKKDYAIPCQFCDRHPVDCESCEEISRTNMASYLRGEVKVYLSETNRMSKEKVLTDEDMQRVAGMSCRVAGKELGVSAQTISRARRARKLVEQEQEEQEQQQEQ